MPTKSQIHCIPEGELDHAKMEDGNIEYDFTLEELNAVVLKHFNPEELKVGDVIHFDDSSDYRNDGKVIWGPDQCVVRLAEEHDEYGYVPSSLPINLFPCVDYFSDSIDHNNFVWFNCEGYKVAKIITVGDDKYFLMPKMNGPHDELHTVPIYEVTYEKKQGSGVKGADLYQVYTYDVDAVIGSHEQMLLLTHIDEFGHEFEGPYSLFDTNSFYVLDGKYAKYLDQKQLTHKQVNKAKIAMKNKGQ